MSDIQTVRADQGAVNARILAREVKVDFRRVEAASIKMRTHLTSAEAKRLFLRTFQTLQLNAHFVSVIARTRLEHKDVEAAEAGLRATIDKVRQSLNDAIDEAEALLKANGVGGLATYDTQPLEIEVGILSSSGRRYLELFSRFDMLMPALQTLEIHDVISTQQLDAKRAIHKRQIKEIATVARGLAGAMRKRMNATTSEPADVRGKGGGASTGRGAAGAPQEVTSVQSGHVAAEAPEPKTVNLSGVGAALPRSPDADRTLLDAGQVRTATVSGPSAMADAAQAPRSLA